MLKARVYFLLYIWAYVHPSLITIVMMWCSNMVCHACVPKLMRAGAYHLGGYGEQSVTRVSIAVQVAKTLPEQISQYAQVVLQTLAYAGTGDVLQIQSLLAMCGEHTEVDENAAWKVSIA